MSLFAIQKFTSHVRWFRGFHSQTVRYCESKSLEGKPYDLHNLENGPNTSTTLTKSAAVDYLTKMIQIRRMENMAAELYKKREIRGFCHLYSGQEACAVGLCAALKPDDRIITAYRSHGYTILRGVSIEGMLAELTGRANGCSRSKGGSMHTYGHEFYGGNGIVGAQTSLGTGLGFASKYTDKDQISLTLFGDGASNQGQLYESYNIAKLWKLPVIFGCENNRYGMGTSVNRSGACPTIYNRVTFVPGILVDGMDILAVIEAAKFCRDYVRENGPIVMELATYRYFGHSMSDPGTSYRSRDEISKVRETSDPIHIFKDKAIGSGLMTEDEVKKIEKDVKADVDKAGKAALEGKMPGDDELTADVYSKPLGGLAMVTTPFGPMPHKLIGKPVNMK